MFRGMKRLSTALTLGSPAFYLALYALWLYGFDNIQARTLLASLRIGLLMLSCARTMAIQVDRGDRGVYWGTAAIYGIHGIAISMRGLRALYSLPTSLPTATLFSHRSIDFLNILTVNLA